MSAKQRTQWTPAEENALLALYAQARANASTCTDREIKTKAWTHIEKEMKKDRSVMQTKLNRLTKEYEVLKWLKGLSGAGVGPNGTITLEDDVWTRVISDKPQIAKIIKKLRVHGLRNEDLIGLAVEDSKATGAQALTLEQLVSSIGCSNNIVLGVSAASVSVEANVGVKGNVKASNDVADESKSYNDYDDEETGDEDAVTVDSTPELQKRHITPPPSAEESKTKIQKLRDGARRASGRRRGQQDKLDQFLSVATSYFEYKMMQMNASSVAGQCNAAQNEVSNGVSNTGTNN